MIPNIDFRKMSFEEGGGGSREGGKEGKGGCGAVGGGEEECLWSLIRSLARLARSLDTVLFCPLFAATPSRNGAGWDE